VPYGGGADREAGTGVSLLNAVNKAARKNSASVPLYSNVFSTSEYHRHRSIHHAISFLVWNDEPQNAIKQKTDRTKQKSQNQTWQDKPMRDASFSGILDLPTADKQIKRKIMNPTRERSIRIAEKFHDICE